MKKYWLLILGMMVLAAAITGTFLIVKKHQKIAGVSARPSTEYPKIEKYEVPILMYHYIRVPPEDDTLGANLSVAPEYFTGQMKYLYDDNYRTIKLTDLGDPNRQAISKLYFEKKKPIVLTFDDGYSDAYMDALPVLKKYGFIGTFFIIKDYIGRDGRLSQNQIDTMAHDGMEFGSHTLTHPDLTKINLDEAGQQIFDSKGEWQVFCYPAGRYNETIINLVKEAGYIAAVTTKIGVARETSNLFELPRVRIENTDVQAFADKISYAMEHS